MELEFIRWLCSQVARDPRVPVGPGDDAAVLSLPGGVECVVTVDLLTDGVDFRLSECDPRRVGRKALAVNLSDLAAMASRPVAALVALVLPRRGGLEVARELYEGMLPLAEKYQVAIAGGDTNSWDGPLAISVTAIGQPGPRGTLRRAGARPGDAILVTGEFGGSLLGKHFDFEPRVQEALRLHELFELHAGIDCSDGLARDIAHMAEASNCGAMVRLDTIPISGAAQAMAASEARPAAALEHALRDGEDFELILAVPPAEARRLLDEQPLDVKVTCVGEFVAERGLWQIDAQGMKTPLEPRGWEHRLA